MKLRRIAAIVQMELKRFLKEPLVLIFTMLLVPALILVFGLTMGSSYGWHPEYSIFEIMVPGFLAYACLLTIYDVASAVASEKELGLERRINTTPLTSGEYVISQMISYSIKPLIQFVLGFGVAYAVGYRPVISFAGYLLVVLFLIILTFCSVGFGLITASFAQTASTAGGLAFIFIVPQQIFGSFIPPEFMGAQGFAWFLPSYYATHCIGLIFAGVPLTDSLIWTRLGILTAISIAIYIIGMISHQKSKRS